MRLLTNLKKVAGFYKALGDETRLKIIEMMSDYEMCVCEIIDRLKMSQPAVSHHLKILKNAGIVQDSREGKWIYYSLNEDVFTEVFAGEDAAILQIYAAPLRGKREDLQASTVRTDPALCEALTNRRNREIKENPENKKNPESKGNPEIKGGKSE